MSRPGWVTPDWLAGRVDLVCTGRGTHGRAVLERGAPHNDGRRPAQVYACPECRRQWRIGRENRNKLEAARVAAAELDLSWW